MERELLCSLEPKEKEHHRKKVLRFFFNWVQKKQKKPASELRLWDWVNSLNPDNASSPKRYKSMSYQFLDRLLSKKEFRQAISPWLDDFAMSLDNTEDDQKTRLFLQFIKHSIAAKEQVQSAVSEFILLNRVRLPKDFNTNFQPVNKLTQAQPKKPGLYFEFRCVNFKCERYNQNMYAYVGVNGFFNWHPHTNSTFCSSCYGEAIHTEDIGFFECKWKTFKVSLANEEVESEFQFCLDFTPLDELTKWKQLGIFVQELNSNEQRFLAKVIPDILIKNATLERRQKDARIVLKANKACQTNIQEEEDLQGSILLLGKRLREQELEMEELRKKVKLYQS